jgi:Type I phosphodiesterase / nucleotide pyrophosphatase
MQTPHNRFCDQNTGQFDLDNQTRALSMTAKRENRRRGTLEALLIGAAMLAGPATTPLVGQATDQRVIVVTIDGMRWQEVFGGADHDLLVGPNGGVEDTALVRDRFWGGTPTDRRRRLLPFLWDSIATGGQVFGDPSAGSLVRVTNGKWFSYPGYNELFSGAPDDRIDSNDKVPNPNVTVLEWLATRRGYREAIAIFGSWDVFPYIFNVERSGLPVTALGIPFPHATSERERTIDDYTDRLPLLWRGSALDAPAMEAALATLSRDRPRVLVVLLGETDEWAHRRRYDLYLDAAHRADQFIADLWHAAQALPEYRGRTSLLLATDHGRGEGRDWTDHGREVPAAERIWMAMRGPKTPPLGVRRGFHGTQSQLAATVASLLGEDWQSARPDAASPIDGGTRQR